MSSAVAALEVVAPAFFSVPEHATSAGAEAADFARELGFALDPEQRMCLDAALAENPNGKWAAFEVGFIGPRQNFKTLLCEIVSMSDLWLGFGSDLIVWSAHEFGTAEESRRHVNELIATYPFLSRRVKKIIEQNGEEGVELMDGKRLRFKARTKTGGRGLAADRTILDEAFALQPSHMGSLMPTMSAKSIHGNPQIIYASSAGMAASSVLRTLRDRGRTGDPSVVYLEWCASDGKCGTEKCDHRVGSVACQLDDRSKWKEANFALGRRIAEDFIATERRAMPPEEFARERLGWWDDPIAAGVGLPINRWKELRDSTSTAETVKGFAVDCAPDFSWSTIAVAAERDDGLGHLEVIEYEQGTHWLVGRVAELLGTYGKLPVFMDSKAPIASLLPEFGAANLEPRLVTAEEFGRACASFLDGLLSGDFRHIGQGELDTAVRVAIRREAGDSWRWSRRMSPLDISPLVAVTLAHWGTSQLPQEAEPWFALG